MTFPFKKSFNVPKFYLKCLCKFKFNMSWKKWQENIFEIIYYPKKLVQVLKFWNLIFALHGKIDMNNKNKVTTKIALHGKIDMKNKNKVTTTSKSKRTTTP